MFGYQYGERRECFPPSKGGVDGAETKDWGA